MRTMQWYNPTIRKEEDVPAYTSDAQAIEMLSGHRYSDRFIEEYRRMRETHSDVVVALMLTGETFYQEHRITQPPGQQGAASVRYRRQLSFSYDSTENPTIS